MKQVNISPKRAVGQSRRTGMTPNGVEASGTYGGATLATPGTPINMNGANTAPSGKSKSNGVMVGNPQGSGGTFQDQNEPAIPGFNARPAAAEALRNLSSKSTSKSRSEFDDAGPAVLNKGRDTGKNRALAKDNPYTLQKEYGKSGAHGGFGKNAKKLQNWN